MSKEITKTEIALLSAADVLAGRGDESLRRKAQIQVKAALAEFGWCSVEDLPPDELAEAFASVGLSVRAEPKQ